MQISFVNHYMLHITCCTLWLLNSIIDLRVVIFFLRIGKKVLRNHYIKCFGEVLFLAAILFVFFCVFLSSCILLLSSPIHTHFCIPHPYFEVNIGVQRCSYLSLPSCIEPFFITVPLLIIQMIV